MTGNILFLNSFSITHLDTKIYSDLSWCIGIPFYHSSFVTKFNIWQRKMVSTPCVCMYAHKHIPTVFHTICNKGNSFFTHRIKKSLCLCFTPIFRAEINGHFLRICEIAANGGNFPYKQIKDTLSLAQKWIWQQSCCCLAWMRRWNCEMLFDKMQMSSLTFSGFHFWFGWQVMKNSRSNSSQTR